MKLYARKSMEEKYNITRVKELCIDREYMVISVMIIRKHSAILPHMSGACSFFCIN